MTSCHIFYYLAGKTMAKCFTLNLKNPFISRSGNSTQMPQSDSTQMPPGVYVEECKWVERPINDVSCDVVAFVGYTEKVTGNNDLFFRPVRVRNLGDFIDLFGGGDGTREDYYLYLSIKLFFENGGGECIVVSVGNNRDGIFADNLVKGLEALKNDFHHSLLVIPEAACLPSLEDSLTVQRAMLRHCADSSYMRFAILDIFGGFSSDGDPVKRFREGIDDSSGNEADWLGFGAAYFPWVKVYNSDTKKEVVIPASGGVAAQYLQQQWRVGLWKAPANLPVKGLTKVSVNLTESEIPSFTNPPDGVPSVNVIKKVPYSEPLIWGARTLTKCNSINRFINVKRTIDMIEHSINDSLAEYQYCANNAETWQKIDNRVNQYLESLRIRGALAGHTRQESYKVNVWPMGKREQEFSEVKEHDFRESQEDAIVVNVSVAMAVPGVFVELGR